MSINKSIHTIDLMLGIPEQEDRSDWYTFMEPLLRDEESKSMFKMPAQYMFKDIPETGSHDDFIQYTIEQMDKFYINQAMIGFHEKSEVKIEAAKKDWAAGEWEKGRFQLPFGDADEFIPLPEK